MIDRAIAALPAEIAAGHRYDDHPALVQRPVRVRSDSAGCTALVWDLCDRNIRFSVVARRNASIHAAISRARANPDIWQQAKTQTGADRDRAQVADLSRYLDLSSWPPRTRLIVRREPLHPGAQRSLFPDHDYRYWGFYTDTDLDPVEADIDMRGHARIEDTIRRLKDSGATRFPFSDLTANRAWLDTICHAETLVRWFQLLCLPARYANAEPKTLRWEIWRTPARKIRHAGRTIIRISRHWPTATIITGAYHHIARLE